MATAPDLPFFAHCANTLGQPVNDERSNELDHELDEEREHGQSRWQELIEVKREETVVRNRRFVGLKIAARAPQGTKKALMNPAHLGGRARRPGTYESRSN